MENKNKIYFSSVQYESNKWLVRFKKCVLLSVRLRVFSEASGSFAVEIIAFKLLPACNRLDSTAKPTVLGFRLEAKITVGGWLSSIWVVNIHIHVSLCPKHCTNKMAKEWQEEIVFQCPVVCGPFTSHFCTEPAFCSTSVNTFPK